MIKKYSLLLALLICGVQRAATQPLPEPLVVRSTWLAALCQRQEITGFRGEAVGLRSLSWLLKALHAGDVDRAAGKVVLLLNGKTMAYLPATHSLAPHAPLPRWPEGPASPLRLAFLPVAGMSQEALWQWRGRSMQILTLAAQAAGLGVSPLDDWAMAVGYADQPTVFAPRKLKRQEKALLVDAEKWLNAGLTPALEMTAKPAASSSPTDPVNLTVLAWSASGRSFYQTASGIVNRTVASPWQRYPLTLMQWDDKQNLTSYRFKRGWTDERGRPGAESWQWALRYLDSADRPKCFLLTWDESKTKQREAVWMESAAMRLNLEVSAALMGLKLRWIPVPAVGLDALPNWEKSQRPLALMVFDEQSDQPLRRRRFADGDFEGESGQWPRMCVLASFSKGVLCDLEIVENESDDQYIDAVLNRLPDAMISQNTWDVDAVSGASLTSVSLIQAVRDAFAKSRKAARGQAQ